MLIPSFAYDLTYRPVDAASGWTQVWNGENRMVETYKGTVCLTFKYDYMGRRRGTGDRRRETGDGRRGTGGVRRETGDERHGCRGTASPHEYAPACPASLSSVALAKEEARSAKAGEGATA